MNEKTTKESFHIKRKTKKMKLFNHFKKSPLKLYKKILQTYFKQTKNYKF